MARFVIVTVDDRSIYELGRWPWPRTVFARLVDALRSYNVGVVGFDMVFSGQDDIDLERAKIVAAIRNTGLSTDKLSVASAVNNDQTFANAIKTQGSTFIGYPLQMKGRSFGLVGVRSGGEAEAVLPGFSAKIAPPAPLDYDLVRLAPGPPPPVPEAVAYLPNLPVINSAARGTAYFDAPTDPDGVFRSEMMVIRFNQRYCEPLILAVISAYANGALTSLTLVDPTVVRIAVGPVALPVDEQGHMLVNFRGPAHTFPYYSVSDVIAHRVPDQALANKIVLVGATALGLGDRWSTPMGADFPGVEIHANAIDNILAGDFIQRSDVTAGLERLAAAVMAIAVAAAVAFLSTPWYSALVATMLMVAYCIFAQYLLVAHGLLLGVLFPIATTFITYAGMASYRYLVRGD